MHIELCTDCCYYNGTICYISLCALYHKPLLNNKYSETFTMSDKRGRVFLLRAYFISLAERGNAY